MDRIFSCNYDWDLPDTNGRVADQGPIGRSILVLTNLALLVRGEEGGVIRSGPDSA